MLQLMVFYLQNLPNVFKNNIVIAFSLGVVSISRITNLEPLNYLKMMHTRGVTICNKPVV